jgi:hypothetical protein
MATGTVTMTTRHAGTRLLIYRFECTSDASGDVVTDPVRLFNGMLTNVKTDPDATDVPTSYSVQVLDSKNLDLLGGLGTTRSTTASEELGPRENGVPKPHSLVNEEFTVVLAGMGNAKKTVVELTFLLA